MTGQFIGYRDGRNTFDFLCPVCESEGEIGVVPNERRLVQCPNECGALFVQRRPQGLFDHPVLVYVAGGQIQELTQSNK